MEMAGEEETQTDLINFLEFAEGDRR